MLLFNAFDVTLPNDTPTETVIVQSQFVKKIKIHKNMNRLLKMFVSAMLHNKIDHIFSNISVDLKKIIAKYGK